MSGAGALAVLGVMASIISIIDRMKLRKFEMLLLVTNFAVLSRLSALARDFRFTEMSGILLIYHPRASVADLH